MFQWYMDLTDGMNLKVWESLPPDVQQVFNELSEWTGNND